MHSTSQNALHSISQNAFKLEDEATPAMLMLYTTVFQVGG